MLENLSVRVLTTDNGDRIGVVYNKVTQDIINVLKLDSTQEMELMQTINDNFYMIFDGFECMDDCEGCEGCDGNEDCKNCEGCNGYKGLTEDNKKNAENFMDDISKTIDDAVTFGIEQVRDLGKFLKDQGSNVASKVNREDIENIFGELEAKNKEILEKYVPKIDDIKNTLNNVDLKKALDKVSSQLGDIIPHTSETSKQKKVNSQLFKALEDENTNITVCLRVFNGVGEDALKALTTVYCKVNGKFTDRYGMFKDEDEQLAWESSHLKQVGEVLASINYTLLKK